MEAALFFVIFYQLTSQRCLKKKKAQSFLPWSLSYWPDIPGHSLVTSASRNWPTVRIPKCREKWWARVRPWELWMSLDATRVHDRSTRRISRKVRFTPPRLLLIFELAAFSRAAWCRVVVHVLVDVRRGTDLSFSFRKYVELLIEIHFYSVRWLYSC